LFRNFPQPLASVNICTHMNGTSRGEFDQKVIKLLNFVRFFPFSGFDFPCSFCEICGDVGKNREILFSINGSAEISGGERDREDEWKICKSPRPQNAKLPLHSESKFSIIEGKIGNFRFDKVHARRGWEVIDLMAFKVNNRMNARLYHVARISDTHRMKIDIITRQSEEPCVGHSEDVYKNVIVIQNTTLSLFFALPKQSMKPSAGKHKRWAGEAFLLFLRISRDETRALSSELFILKYL
jgi:hypothetical protein